MAYVTNIQPLSTWQPTFLNYKDIYFTHILMSVPRLQQLLIKLTDSKKPGMKITLTEVIPPS